MIVISGLLIVGAGGHGKVVADIACEIGHWSKIAFLDDKYPDLSGVLVWPVIGKISDAMCFLKEYPDILVAIGNSRMRLELLRILIDERFRIPVLVHPGASVSRYTNIGGGTVVCAQAAIKVDTRIGMGSIINAGSTIGHDCVIGECVHIAPGARVSGEVSVGECSWLGCGSTVIEQIKVGSDVVVGAGSVITKDIPDNVTVVGVPGKIIKRHSVGEGTISNQH